ncbi:MAG: uncharacterized protein A8A55_0629 [Amphiamblys sp. WSBS2006]|nr:MAG: uncharacterized protein A8A55_0629 [Amphiamblys sp. WSBS2006]
MEEEPAQQHPASTQFCAVKKGNTITIYTTPSMEVHRTLHSEHTPVSLSPTARVLALQTPTSVELVETKTNRVLCEIENTDSIEWISDTNVALRKENTLVVLPLCSSGAQKPAALLFSLQGLSPKPYDIAHKRITVLEHRRVSVLAEHNGEMKTISSLAPGKYIFEV